MKKFLLTALALSFTVSPLGFAAEKKKPADAKPAAVEPKKEEPKAAGAGAPKEEAKARPVPFHGDVAAVDASAKTFSFKSKEGKERVFAVTDKTKITKDGAPADFGAITVGSYATGQYNKTADGKQEAVSVKIGAKPEKKAKAPNADKAAGDAAKPAEKKP